jgi:hypothetical protein
LRASLTLVKYVHPSSLSEAANTSANTIQTSNNPPKTNTMMINKVIVPVFAAGKGVGRSMKLCDFVYVNFVGGMALQIASVIKGDIVIEDIEQAS